METSQRQSQDDQQHHGNSSSNNNNNKKERYFLLSLMKIGVVSILLITQFNEFNDNIFRHSSSFVSFEDNSKVATTPAVIDTASPKQIDRPAHPMCQRLLSNTSSLSSSSQVTNLAASDIWIQNWDKILDASFFPYSDIDDNQREVYRNLMIDIFPRLHDAVLTPSYRERDVQRIWDILEARRTNLDESPPLKVLVVGGSVAEGVGCVQPLPSAVAAEESKKRVVRGRKCNWSRRLEQFVNMILGFDGIQIIDASQGGTGTSQAIFLIKYWIYPKSLQGKAPDVIIHAFGSNDSHLGEPDGNEKNRIQALFEQGVERLNDFTRTVFSSHSCPTPVIIHLDDYFGGHGQGSLLGDFTYRRVLTLISKWYGNLAVSSARVIGPLVYVDTMGEDTFSPQWTKEGSLIENCHFQYLGHQTVMLSMAYRFLHSAVGFCNQMAINEIMKEKSQLANNRRSHVLPLVEQLKDTMPPPLDFTSDLATISDEWRAERDRQEEHCQTTGTSPPCVMAWTTGREGPTASIPLLNKSLMPFLSKKVGWEFEEDISHGWSRKLGLAANEMEQRCI